MKVIAFSLWGDNPIYTVGAIRNAELAQDIYPDWVCRFYIGASTPPNIKDALAKFQKVDVIAMPEDGNWSGLFWRFLAASDPNVDVMISRDTDSRLNSREKAAVDEWLESNRSFHIMRDHPYHKTAILGGMWGVKYPKLRDIRKWVTDYNKGEFWQVDQNFLRDIVYPLVRNDSKVHDEFFDKQPFPTLRKEKYFVGQAFDEKDRPLHPENGELLGNICSSKPDWDEETSLL